MSIRVSNHVLACHVLVYVLRIVVMQSNSTAIPSFQPKENHLQHILEFMSLGHCIVEYVSPKHPIKIKLTINSIISFLKAGKCVGETISLPEHRHINFRVLFTIVLSQGACRRNIKIVSLLVTLSLENICRVFLKRDVLAKGKFLISSHFFSVERKLIDWFPNDENLS